MTTRVRKMITLVDMSGRITGKTVTFNSRDEYRKYMERVLGEDRING